jgi:ABC-2 type transport system ATP-binding protein
MTALIEAHRLRKSFSDTDAVKDVSLVVHPGEAYGLVGPDGAGKTTTLRLLAGVLANEGGDVRIAGYDMRTHAEQARARLGYLSQRFSLYADLTVRENLLFFGEMRGMTGAALARRAPELLDFVGLAGFEARRTGQLSGGMKQKLGLATALIHRPAVLLLDEPTGGVDPLARQDFWQLIIRLLAEGTAVVVTSPYMDEAVRCNRLGSMMGGRILTEGSPRELVRRFDGEVLELVAHPKDSARQVALAVREVRDAIVFGDRLHLHVADAQSVSARLPLLLDAAHITVTRLRPIPPTLEDLFLSLLDPAATPP